MSGDTWELRGSRWEKVLSANAPQPRSGHAMAFDMTRSVTVLFGGSTAAYGYSGVDLDDTWLFDGNDWRAVDPAHRPPPRSNHSMAHDIARARTVMFGGGQMSWSRNDTWEWDGTDWREVLANTSPPPRHDAALAYDLIRRQTVMFGGDSSSNYPRFYNDTWVYDGIDWQQVQPLGAPLGLPPGRSGHALAFDLQRSAVVMFGGMDDGGFGNLGTWAWDGGRWVEVAQPQAMPPEAGIVATFDNARGVTIGFSHFGGLWELDGQDWQINHATGRSVSYAAATFDRARARTLVFGGTDYYSLLDDTASFDGLHLRSLRRPIAPPARQRAAMAWDAVRRQAVLFGGEASYWGNGQLSDTWVFDGVDWHAANTNIAPAPRSGHAMVYDAGRDRLLLYGGASNYQWPYTIYGDTWSFADGQWSRLPTNAGPGPRYDHAMAYDPVRGAVLLCGRSSTTWRLDGATWSQLALPEHPLFFGAQMVYDDRRARVVLYDAGIRVTWFLPEPDAASFARYGRGCAGSAGTPSLDSTAGALPVLGAPFALDLTALPPQPGIALLMFGFDLVRWNGQLLPVDLASLGLPGCDLWLAPIATFALAHGGGSLRHVLAIPNTLALRGATFSAQAVTFDPAAGNGVGAVSNGAILRLW